MEELLELCPAFGIFHLPPELAEAPDQLPDGIPGPFLWRSGIGGINQGAAALLSGAALAVGFVTFASQFPWWPQV